MAQFGGTVSVVADEPLLSPPPLSRGTRNAEYRLSSSSGSATLLP